MSRSSGDRGGSRGHTRAGRGQVEPLAALVAVFAVTAALGLYTGTLRDATPDPGGDSLAPTALDAVAEVTSDRTGVIDPARLSAASAAGPDDHRLNVTLTVAGRQWHAGPPTPAPTADRAARRVAVATGPHRTAVGRLRVVVW